MFGYFITLLYTPICIWVGGSTKRSYIYFAIVVIAAYIFTWIGLFGHIYSYGPKGVVRWNPFSQSVRKDLISVSYTDQVRYSSIMHSVGFILADKIVHVYDSNHITLDDINISIPISREGYNSYSTFNNKIILILVESLENWAVNVTSTPNLWSYMNNHPHFHATKITKQIKAGTSADGQMIINTGLLPIEQGATCFRFPTNKFPSIGECCEGKSATILPHQIGIWNQQYMSPAYAYDTTIILGMEDSVLFQETVDCLHDGFQMLQTITMSSHSPFIFGASRSHLQLPHEMPKDMSNYLKSINYFDEGLQVLLEQVDADPLLSNATIVITGDHTIFTDEMRVEYGAICQENNLPFAIEEGFCPLIIFSPFIKENILITDSCYQMDIYPTIMHLIGCENYYWNGFGVNLLDSTARCYRPFTEAEAYEISDMLIRSNYFADHR